MIEIKTKSNFLNESGNGIHIHYGRTSGDYKEWKLHGHEFFELELFTNGTGYQILNGEKYDITRGSVHLITTSDFHEMYWDADVEQIGVRFEQSIIESDIIERIFSLRHAVVCDLEEEEYKAILNIMQTMASCYMAENFPMREQFIKNMLESVIILLLRKFIILEKENDLSRSQVQHAIAYIEMNFKNDPGLLEVATYVGLNKNYFSTLFKKATGKSFVQYVIDLKLEYSKNLILSSDMTMNEVCYNSGFKSFSNFSREFKRKFNKTPLQYRKNK